MNPISATPAIGRAAANSDASPVPSDLAGLFAMMFAATTAAPPPPPPTPLVLSATPAMGSAPATTAELLSPSPDATPSAEGEVPTPPPGGWPGREALGRPAFPGLTTTGRQRLERPGLTPTLEDFAPARRDFAGPVMTSPSAVLPAPDAAADVPAPLAPTPLAGATTAPGPAVAAEHVAVLAAAIAAALPQPLRANAAPKLVTGTPGVALPLADAAPGQGEPLLADTARDGGRGVRRRPGEVLPAVADATGEASRGRGKGTARTAGLPERSEGASRDEFAAGPAFPGVADSAPATVPVAPPPHAQGVGVLAPHVRMPDVPATAGVTSAGPVELPPEPQSSANPSHATVSFDSGDGQEGRLRVSLRGDTLRATIQMPDAAAAQRMEQDLGELTRALRTHGFEQARLTVDAPRSASNTERGHDDTQPREHKNLRDERSHSGDRNSARRERNSSRQER